MNLPREHPLAFFTTPPHDCGYLPSLQAVTLFMDPRVSPDRKLYTALSQHGFRRSGEHVYRPHCPDCQACVPVRVRVAEFAPSRAQRRCLTRNADLAVSEGPGGYSDEHFELYARYIRARHAGGGMDNPEEKQYRDFLLASWAETRFIEFRLADRLLGVAVIDQLDGAWSAVYTFFDPAEQQRGLGRFAILKEIELAAECGLEWLYLGYWIDECRKMAYKTEYRPQQRFTGGAWHDA